jgi:uncharacterized membrane protein
MSLLLWVNVFGTVIEPPEPIFPFKVIPGALISTEFNPKIVYGKLAELANVVIGVVATTPTSITTLKKIDISLFRFVFEFFITITFTFLVFK